MRVCLIHPPCGFLIDERVFPPLGVCKVAAALESRPGYEVHILDLSGVSNIADVVVDDLENHPCDAYGFTATMPQMPAAAEIARIIAGYRPRARRILGGPHPTLLRASERVALSRGHESNRATRMLHELRDRFHVIVAGDGERAVFEALRPIPQAFIDAEVHTSPLFLSVQEITDAPWPARHLLDIDSYRYQIDGVKTQSLIAQLGCPFGCNFCGGRRSPFLRRMRVRSVTSVIGEMFHLYKTYGTQGFMFLDDELNVSKSFEELLLAIIALQVTLGVDFKLRGLVKSELVTDRQAHLMYQAGFRQLLIGFESGSDRMLLNMNKGATVDENTRCLETLTKHGIRVKALMSLGHPGETVETAQATEDWLLRVQPADFDVTIITVYPGTPYFDDVQPVDGHFVYTAKNGDQLFMEDVDHLRDVNFYKGMPGAYQSFVWTQDLSREDICAVRDTVEARVRKHLEIPYPTASAAVQYEHSMGCR